MTIIGACARRQKKVVFTTWYESVKAASIQHDSRICIAEYLLGRGAELNRIGYDRKTPPQVANESSAKDLAPWLRSRGARLSEEFE